MNAFSIVFGIFNGGLTVYIICFFFGVFAPRRHFKGDIVAFLTVFSAFILSLLFVNDEIANFVIMLSVVVCMSLFYDMKWYNHFFLSIVIVLISSFCELLVAIASSAIYNVPMERLKVGGYFILGVLLSKLLAFLIVAIIRIGKHSLLSGKLKRTWTYISLLPITSILFVLMIADYMYLIEDEPIKQFITVGVIMLLIVTNILVFYVIDRLYDSMIAEHNLIVANQLIEYQEQQYKALLYGQSEIRRMRHDMKNILIGISAELKAGKISEIESRLLSGMNKLDDVRSRSITGNGIIDAIIAEKMAFAEKHGVRIDVESNISNEIVVDGVDLAILLGNAIDNAVEASDAVITHEKVVKIQLVTKNSILVIVVNNPVDKVVDIGNMTTTKLEKQSHGFGRMSMMRVAQKHGGDVSFECSDSSFKLTIILSNMKTNR